MSLDLAHRAFASPIGELRLVATAGALVGVFHPTSTRVPPLDARPTGDHPVLDQAERELAEYFRGDRERFEVPLSPRGTAFQHAVWDALSAVPFGETCAYGDLARRIGRPSAVRAVGAANGANPLSVVVPCHRVVGADGTLTGYAGGLPAKRWLLQHERALPPSLLAE